MRAANMHSWPCLCWTPSPSAWTQIRAEKCGKQRKLNTKSEQRLISCVQPCVTITAARVKETAHEKRRQCNSSTRIHTMEESTLSFLFRCLFIGASIFYSLLRRVAAQMGTETEKLLSYLKRAGAPRSAQYRCKWELLAVCVIESIAPECPPA